MAIDKALISKLYHDMLLIRRVEEYICEVYHTDAIKSPVHLSIGQESIAVGVCAPLNKDDMVSNTYRCHATYIAKGGNLNQMMAELYGKSDGCASGKAGSMHLIDMPNGVMGASAVVGTTIPVAAGYAWALKQQARTTGKQRIVACVFGDGATEEGCFIETINFAALHKLPIIFVCENNGLAIHSKVSQRWATDRLRERIETYNIPTYHIPDGDVFKIRDIMINAISNARQGNGASFIECNTYRWLEHVGPADDHGSPYRSQEELDRWKTNDQIARLEKMLDKSEAEQIKANVEKELKSSIKFAEDSPFLEDNASLMRNVYAA